MKKTRYAVRNLSLCTKDCLCLYVCPTGATDTEDSIIDRDKCIGCGACADACPSKAISLVPLEMPLPQPKTEAVVQALDVLTSRKVATEQAARSIAGLTESDTLCKLMRAISDSSRIMEEDLMRESGYMLPQSENARVFLQALAANPPAADFPVGKVEELLAMMPFQEEAE